MLCDDFLVATFTGIFVFALKGYCRTMLFEALFDCLRTADLQGKMIDRIYSIRFFLTNTTRYLLERRKGRKISYNNKNKKKNKKGREISIKRGGGMGRMEGERRGRGERGGERRREKPDSKHYRQKFGKSVWFSFLEMKG